jgi:hypothetical protein
MNEADYMKALEVANAATLKYQGAQKAYRAREIGDDEFLTAQSEYKQAEMVFDAAFSEWANAEPAPVEDAPVEPSAQLALGFDLGGV